jgi:glc operon protein GlcG
MWTSSIRVGAHRFRPGLRVGAALLVVVTSMAAAAAEMEQVRPAAAQSDVAQPGPPPAPPIGPPVTLAQAQAAAQAAMTRASAIGVPNAVTIVEPTGELVLFAKMDGAPYSAMKLAQQKAVASARYRRPTKAFFDAVESGRLFFLTFPEVSAVPGGVPLVINGKIAGAIGVSGGSAEQDIQVAGAGAEAVK